MKYRIYKFVDANNKSWYQVKRKWFFFYRWMGTMRNMDLFVVEKFRTLGLAKSWVESDMLKTDSYKKSKKVKIVECVEL
jgi:hypothetical protein